MCCLLDAYLLIESRKNAHKHTQQFYDSVVFIQGEGKEKLKWGLLRFFFFFKETSEANMMLYLNV